MDRRHFHRLAVLGAAALTLGIPAALSFGAAPVPQIYTDPANAGPDYPYQGEYVGKAGGHPLAAQVMALGNGTFRAQFLPGGLPGDGWDGKTRVRVEGRTDGSRVVFGTESAGWNARIEDRKLSGVTDKGEKFELKPVVRTSPTAGLKPPPGALVLFDGMGTDAWAGNPTTQDGMLLCGPRTKSSFTDFTLHLEFRSPFKPEARGQARGNSGVYLLGRYEIQILDSFGLDGLDNECGGLYRQKAPAVNMCYPPLTWQTYDIDFQAARFDAAGQKTRNAVITVRHNGVPIHENYELTGPTGGGKRAGETGAAGPILLQNHGNPVLFRNMWLVEKK